MNSSGGTLSFDAYIKDSDFKRSVDEMQRRIVAFSKRTVDETANIDRAFSRLSQLAAGYFTFSQLAQLPAQIVRVRGEFQQLEIAFRVMLKSKAAADSLLQDSIRLAAATPFSVKDVTQGAKQLLAYGSTANSVIGEIRMLGDVASGTGTQLGDLIYLYGTLRSQGRAYAVDIRQFAGRGIPIYAELAKVLGTNVDQVNKFVEEGKVGFKEVEQAFKNMTTGQGLFTGLMEAQSKSLTGLLERLGDAWEQMLNKIGKENEGFAAGVINSTSSLIEHYQDVLDVLGILVATYGTYKTATVVANVAMERQAAVTDLVTASTTELAAAQEASQARFAKMTETVNALSASRAAALKAAAASTEAVAAAKVDLQVAQAQVEATKNYIDSKKREQAVKAADAASNRLLAATDAEVLARKKAVAASSEYYAAKTLAQKAATEAATVSEVALTRAEASRLTIQQALNKTLLDVNPYVAAAAALVGLIALSFALKERTIDLVDARELLKEGQAEATTQFHKESAEISALISLMQNKNVADSARIESYNKLKTLAPDIVRDLNFEQAAVANLTQATQEYLIALERKINLEANQKRLTKAIEQRNEANQLAEESRDRYLRAPSNTFRTGPDVYNDAFAGKKSLEAQMNAAARDAQSAQKVVDTINKSIEQTLTGGTKTAIESRISVLRQVLEGLKDAKTGAAFKKTEDEIKSLEKTLESFNKKGTETKKTFSDLLAEATKTDAKPVDLLKLIPLAKTENEVKALTEAISKAKAELDLTSDAYKMLDKAYDRLKGKKPPKAPDLAIQKGSLADYEKQIKDIDELISKTDANQLGKIQKLMAQRQQLERKAEEIRKQQTIKSFDDELDERKKRYELYYRWVDAYGKESADKAFPSLIKNGKDFVTSLKNQVLGFDAKVGAGSILTAEELSRYQKLKDLIAENDGHETMLERFNKELQEVDRNSVNLTDKLAALRKIQASLNPNDFSPDGIAKRKQVSEAILGTEVDRREQLRSFMEQVTNSEKQRTAIQAKYADLRKALDEVYLNDKGEAYQQSIWNIDKAEQDELTQSKLRFLEESDAYKALQETILATGRAAILERIKREQAYLDTITGNSKAELEERRKTIKAIKDLNDQLIDDTVGKMDQLAQLAADFGSALGDGFASFGRSISVIGSQVGSLVKNIKEVKGLHGEFTGKNKLEFGGYVAAAQAVIGMIGNTISATRQLRKEQEDYYRAVTIAQRQYNVLLNDQIGTQTEIGENVFVKDYVGRVKDGMEMLEDARKQQASLLNDLVKNGLYKSGLKDARETGGFWDRFKAGISGLGSLFGGGLKTVDQYTSLLAQYPNLIKKGADGWENLDKELAQTLISQNLVDQNTKDLLESAIEWQEQIDKAKEKIRSVISEISGDFGNTLRDALVTAFREGQDAAQAFGDSVAKVVENLVSQLIFSKVFKDNLNFLETGLTNAIATGNETDIIDVFKSFYDKAQIDADTYQKLLKLSQEYAKQAGFEIFQTSNDVSKAKGVTGAIQGVTEQTAGVIEGQMNAIRITQAQGIAIMNAQLFHLAAISNNSRYLVHLESISDKMEKVTTGLRAKGILG